MKFKKGFVLCEICGQNVLFNRSLNNEKPMDLISLNESATYLFKEVIDKEFTPEFMAELLCARYKVEYAVALRDAQTICNGLIESGIVEY